MSTGVHVWCSRASSQPEPPPRVPRMTRLTAAQTNIEYPNFGKFEFDVLVGPGRAVHRGPWCMTSLVTSSGDRNKCRHAGYVYVYVFAHMCRYRRTGTCSSTRTSVTLPARRITHASPQTAMNRIFKIYSINRFVWNSRSYMHLGCHKTVHMRLRFLGVRTAPEFETRDRINRMKNRRVPPCTTDKERLPRALAMFRIVPKFETHARQRLTFPFPFVHH